MFNYIQQEREIVREKRTHIQNMLANLFYHLFDVFFGVIFAQFFKDFFQLLFSFETIISFICIRINKRIS